MIPSATKGEVPDTPKFTVVKPFFIKFPAISFSAFTHLPSA